MAAWTVCDRGGDGEKQIDTGHVLSVSRNTELLLP